MRDSFTTKDSISALREQTTLAKTRPHGVLRRKARMLSVRSTQRLPVIGLGLLASLGCAGGSSGPGPGIEPERAPEPVVREAARPITTPVRAGFQYAAGNATYLVTTDATIAEVDSAGSAPREFREIARIELVIAPAAGYTLVTTRGSVERAAVTSPIPLAVDTIRAGGMDAVAEPRMPICGRDTVPPMHLVTLLPPVPLELRDGQRWTQRRVYPTCQGAIPIRVERTDTYTITGRAQDIAGQGVSVSRSSSLAYSGAGVEGQHNVRVAGSGSAQATLVLDASAGRLISAREESTSEIAITSSGRTRRFSQHIVTTVTRP